MTGVIVPGSAHFYDHGSQEVCAFPHDALREIITCFIVLPAPAPAFALGSSVSQLTLFLLRTFLLYTHWPILGTL